MLELLAIRIAVKSERRREMEEALAEVVRQHGGISDQAEVEPVGRAAASTHGRKRKYERVARKGKK